MNARLNRPVKLELVRNSPLDHIEPQATEDHRVCHHFPGCLCGEECIDLRAESPIARTVEKGLIVATILVGIGLLYVGLRG